MGAITDAAVNSLPDDGNDVPKSTLRSLFRQIDDAIAAGDGTAQNWKTSVRVATTANGTWATAFDNGSTVDDIVLATNDRILIKNQTDATQNGIYIVQASGAPVRATDADSAAEIAYARVIVNAGTANEGTAWVCQQGGTVTLGTDNITFAELPSFGAVSIASTDITDASIPGRTVLTSPDAAGIRTYLSLVPGTNVQAYNVNLTAWAGRTAPASAIVGETDAQTLTNKTLTSPTLNGGTLANMAVSGTFTVPNTGLKLLDTNASHSLAVAPGSDLTANRTLTITTGDADRTLAMGGNITTAGAFTVAGAYALTATLTGATSVTFPTTGALTTVSAESTARVGYDRERAWNGLLQHDIPVVGSVIRVSASQYLIDSGSEDLARAARTGAVDKRLTYLHDIPVSDDLIILADGSYRLRGVGTTTSIPTMGAFADSDGNASAATATAGWRLYDGADVSGAPKIKTASADPTGLNLVEVATQTGYDGLPRFERFPFDVTFAVAPGITKILLVSRIGQSLNVSASYRAINTTCPAPGQLLMFQGGIRPGLHYGNDAVPNRFNYMYTPARLGGVVNMVEQVDSANAAMGESGTVALCNAMLANVDSDTAIFGLNVSISGASIQQIQRGTAVWRNWALAVGYLRALCEYRGIQLIIGPTIISQGSSNFNDTVATYKGRIEALYDDINDVAVWHGQAAHSAPLFGHAMCHNNNQADMPVARSWLELMNDPVRRIVAVGPEYPFPNVDEEGDGADTTHMGAISTIQRALGYEYPAIVSVYFNAGTRKPLHMTAAVLAGTTITIDFNSADSHFTLPLVSNPSNITAPTNGDFGFQLLDNGDGTTPNITTFSIDGSNKGLLGLSGAWTSTNKRLGAALQSSANGVGIDYQGPTIGVRSVVADSTATTFSIDGETRTGFQHLHPQIINVTT